MSGLKSPPSLKALAFCVEYNNKRQVEFAHILTCFPILCTFKESCVVPKCFLNGVHNHVLPANYTFLESTHKRYSPYFVTPPQKSDLSINEWRAIVKNRLEMNKRFFNSL